MDSPYVANRLRTSVDKVPLAVPHTVPPVWLYGLNDIFM